MHAKKTTWILLQSFGVCLLIILLAGCSTKFFTYKGSWVAEDNRISLQEDEPRNGTWQTRDVTIDYAYQKKMQNLRISGEVTLGRYLTMGFSTLDDLTLDLHMLDTDGIVLDSQLIRIFAYRLDLHTLGKMTFDKQFELPADTAAIAFGYRGKVSEGGGGIHGDESGGQIDWNFWEVPGRKPSE